jgi:two-component system, OmpR family, phosphate regulon sensor histidine kinase PhoR
MNHKRLARWSIFFIVLIFLSQSFLIVRLFQVNYDFLGKLVNTTINDVYTKDMNKRLGQISRGPHPVMAIEEMTPKRKINGYNVDAMKGVDHSNSVTLVNIAFETFLSNLNPMKLSAIDSAAALILQKENIHAEFYTRIVDLKTGKELQRSNKDVPVASSASSVILSKNVPLNFQQTKVLQLVLLNPLKTVLNQMLWVLVLSFLLCLFCIYCLFSLQRTLSRQKKLAQSKSDFYNQVSHELKRPVSVVYQALDSLLNTKAIENPARRERYMTISMAELYRMNSKIDMIMALSMEEEGMFKLNQTELNLPELVAEVRERYFITLLKPTDIQIQTDLKTPFIHADKDHLFQCLSNLIDNAIKYSGESVSIAIRLFEEAGATCISIRDDGDGIQESNLVRIFQKFERANTEKKLHGYGIGLSYVKQIVEKHGGEIAVQSVLGTGSEFIIRLPQA